MSLETSDEVPYRKSLFEIEAERTLNLNKGKQNPKGKWSARILGGLIGLLLSVIIFGPILIYGFFTYGFVGMKFWQWFIVPVFHIQQIGLFQTIGILLFVRLLIYRNTAGQKMEEDPPNKTQIVIASIIFPWAALLCGYIVHCFLK